MEGFITQASNFVWSPALVALCLLGGLWFSVRGRFLQLRLIGEMIRLLFQKKVGEVGISSFQALTMTLAGRVGTGNIAGVATAICFGGPGALFWMWVVAFLGASSAFVESTLGQVFKVNIDGEYRGGPAYYIHYYAEKVRGKKLNHSVIAVFFALSGLLCWCGISQVISNSVSTAFANAFHIPPLYTTILLVVLAAVIVLRKHATVKVLDIMVPIMAGCYFFITLFIIFKNIGQLPAVFHNIFSEAFGFRQVVAGGFHRLQNRQ